MDEWLFLLTRGAELDPESEVVRGAEPCIREAVEVLSAFTKPEKARHRYEKRLEWERVMLGMKEEARRLKALGVDHDIIAQGTGLGSEEVEGL